MRGSAAGTFYLLLLLESEKVILLVRLASSLQYSSFLKTIATTSSSDCSAEAVFRLIVSELESKTLWVSSLKAVTELGIMTGFTRSYSYKSSDDRLSRFALLPFVFASRDVPEISNSATFSIES